MGVNVDGIGPHFLTCIMCEHEDAPQLVPRPLRLRQCTLGDGGGGAQQTGLERGGFGQYSKTFDKVWI